MTESGKKNDAIGQQLALLDSDPAAGVLAVADLREQRAKAMPAGPYRVEDYGLRGNGRGQYVGFIAGIESDDGLVAEVGDHWNEKASLATAEHIAAEANPEHALAAVRRWRGVVEQHAKRPADVWSRQCKGCRYNWPCPDLIETADEARAYLGRP